MRKQILLLLILNLTTLCLFSQEKDFTLNGIIGGLQNEMISIYKETGERVEFMDSLRTTNGEFKLTGKTSQAFAIQIRIPNRKRAKLFISPGKMNLFVHAKDFKFGFLTEKLSGSEAQDRYEDYTKLLEINNEKKLKIANTLEMPEVYADSVQKTKLKAEYKKLNQFKSDYFKKYASSPVIPYLIYQEFFSKRCDLDFVKGHLTLLKKANPTGMYVNNLNRRVILTAQLNENGDFPHFTAKDLNGSEFDLEQTKGKPVLLYIWRAWMPERNKRHYDFLKEMRVSFPDLQIINLIRNSSYNTIRVNKKNTWVPWKPKPMKELNCIELESYDRSIDFVGCLSRSTYVYFLDENGKIILKDSQPKADELKAKLAEYL